MQMEPDDLFTLPDSYSDSDSLWDFKLGTVPVPLRFMFRCRSQPLECIGTESKSQTESESVCKSAMRLKSNQFDIQLRALTPSSMFFAPRILHSLAEDRLHRDWMRRLGHPQKVDIRLKSVKCYIININFCLFSLTGPRKNHLFRNLLFLCY